MSQALYILGDSHMGALLRGSRPTSAEAATGTRVELRRLKTGSDCSVVVWLEMVDGGDLLDRFLLKLADGNEILNPVFLKSLHSYGLYNRYTDQFEFNENINIVLLNGYHVYHRIGFNKEWLRFRIFGRQPGDIDHDDRYAIPHRLLKDVISGQADLFFRGMARLKEQGGWKLHFLAGPPPHRSMEQLIERRLWSQAIDATTRRAVWEVVNEVMVEGAAELGARHLDFSHRFADADGFLRPEFCGDGIHANAAYGAAVLGLLYREFSLRGDE